MENVLISIVTLVEILLFSDIFFGFNSLTPVYKDLGVFSDLCEAENITNSTGFLSCDQQNKQYGLAFIVWLSVQASLAPFLGHMFDKFGIVKSRVAVVIFFTIGSILYALSEFFPYLLFPAGCLMALSSLGICLSNCAIASITLTKYRNLVISFQSGLMATSAIVFLIFNKIYYLGVPLYASFTVLSCLCVITIIGSTFGLIKKALKRKNEKDLEIPLNEITDDDIEINEMMDGDNNQEIKSEKLILKSLKRVDKIRDEFLQDLYPTKILALKSGNFLTNILFFTFTLYRFVFFVSQLGLQLVFLFKDDTKTINNLLENSSIFFSVGVLISIGSGYMIDFIFKRIQEKIIKKSNSIKIMRIQVYQLNRTFVIPLLICNICELTASLLVNIPNIYVYYFIFILFCICRSFNSGLLGSYLSLMFPKRYLGTLIGTTIFIAGFSVVTQYPLMYYAGPGQYPSLINYIMIICPVIASIHPIRLIFVK